MTGLIRQGGRLLLSGIPLQDKFDVQLRFERLGCQLLDMRILEEYVTILLVKG
jgi:ribosomal protein L11 methyltransferase